MKHGPGFLKLIESVRPSVREVSIAETQARLAARAKVRLIDVREDREWDAGHITGAEHMGRGIIERDIEARVPDTGEEIILYCGGGYRSVLVAESLAKMGYTNVASMAGGWRGWKEAGGATEKL